MLFRSYAHNLTITEREAIENYDLLIYICEGNDLEKLEWFKIVNIAGEKLSLTLSTLSPSICHEVMGRMP